MGETSELIGEDLYIYDGGYTELDDDVDIERSTGSDPHFTVPFSQEDFEPYRWHLHRPTEHMLCAEDEQYGSRVASLDLEHGGAVVARYLGHGGAVRKFSTSPGDAHLFATACSDGFARLYDIRTPLPITNICVEGHHSLTGDVEFTHIDGLPIVFSGGTTSQAIMLWDIRNKKCVYELSTGNNAVSALAWSPTNATLYAATDCPYVNMGQYDVEDYRKMDAPPDETCPGDHSDIRSDESEDDAKYEDEYDGEHAHQERPGRQFWPNKAIHDEKSFGYLFDAARSTLFQYAFKEDPRPDVLLAYGYARPSRSFTEW